jgi:hypothetical protein
MIKKLIFVTVLCTMIFLAIGTSSAEASDVKAKPTPYKFPSAVKTFEYILDADVEFFPGGHFFLQSPAMGTLYSGQLFYFVRSGYQGGSTQDIAVGDCTYDGKSRGQTKVLVIVKIVIDNLIYSPIPDELKCRPGY